MTKRIVIEAEPVEKITVSLVGKDYLLTPPKGALGLGLARRAEEAKAAGNVEAIWGEVISWLTSAVGAKQAARIQARLDDPADLLDIIHIVNLMERVTEAVTGSPTSSPSD